MAQIITDNNRNNLERAQGLLYFCGGQATYGKDPEKTCEISATKWVADLESRTKFNFTDEGSIELAKQYMIGPAKEVLSSAILISGYDWEGVKDKIQEVYAEEEDFVKYNSHKIKFSHKEAGRNNKRILCQNRLTNAATDKNGPRLCSICQPRPNRSI